MKKIYRLSVLAILLLSFTGCEKLLEVTPESQITEDMYFSSEGDFDPYVNGIYSQIRDLVGVTAALQYGTERSEELVNAINSRLNSAAWQQTLSAVNGGFNYNNYYKAIGNCNLLLDRIEPFAFTNTSLKNRLQAEAYAQRAFLYFQLVRIIGDTPLMLQAITDYNDIPLLPRSNAVDVMKQISSDIDKASSLFPDKGFNSKYRFSYPATQALKAEVKLWSAKVLGGGDVDFNDAITAVQEVEKANVSLLAKFRDITTVSANAEIILSSYFQRYEKSPNYGINALPFLVGGVSGASNLDSLPYAKTTVNGQGGYQISLKSRSLFSGLTATDQRIPNTFIIERVGSTQRYAWVNKYPGNVYSDDRVSDNDIILYRLADIYLIAAEAYAGLASANTTKAIEYLDKVRVRAGNGPYTGATDKPSVELEIFKERGREMFFENKRWYDIVRFHFGGTINAYTYVPNLVGKTIPLFWPLSSEVLAANTSLKQTTGYPQP